MPDRPTIVHVIDQLAIGGMENGIVNILNRTSDLFEHKIVCLSYSDPKFQARIQVPGLEVVALDKKEGKDPGFYGRLFRFLRRARPDVVHTRNLPTIDLAPVIRAAGVRRLIHGEHGRGLLEPDGTNFRYNTIRRVLSPLVSRYVCVSRDLAQWLCTTVGVPERKIEQIYNGVDAHRFAPRTGSRSLIPDVGPDDLLIGTVGRMDGIKDQVTLAEAFVHLVAAAGEHGPRLRLVMIGEGSLRAAAQEILGNAGLAGRAWLPGACHNVAELIRELDIFVLPSRNEGISNTILEAMATGLPVVATAVGGNRELVVPERTGRLVPAGDPRAMSDALLSYVTHPHTIRQHGDNARQLALTEFSLDTMISRYTALYRQVCV